MKNNIQIIKDKLISFFNGGFDESEHSLHTISKVRMLNAVYIVGVLNLFIWGIFSFMHNDFLLGIFDFSIAILFFFIIILLRKTKNYDLLSTIGITIVGLFYLYLLVIGGVSKVTYLWYYTFPLLAYFLLNPRKGTIATASLLGATIIYFLIQDNFTNTIKYGRNFIFDFTASFLVVFAISYIFEKTKEKVYEIIYNKNDQLAKSILKLEENEKELKKLHNELEDRVNKRTLELNQTNQQLLEEIKLKNAATKKAEAAVKTKTNFLAQMSHEIRTPINSILSYTQLLKEETLGKIPGEFDFCFDMINNGGRRLIRTIDLILNMSELQTGTYEIIIEKFNLLDDILSPLVGEFKTNANAKNIQLFVTNKTENDEIFLTADNYTVTQIFANLIDNAIKYTKEGKVEIIITKVNDSYNVDIKDTGIGISEEYQKNLFSPFTQEEQGYTRRFEGNGLGMALVREYCSLNQIDISLTSTKNLGTTFHLEFQPDIVKVETPKQIEY